MPEEKCHILLLSNDDKKRLIKVTEGIIDKIQNDTQNIEEQAFILKILIETFEETKNCIVPFKNRYTEPFFKKG